MKTAGASDKKEVLWALHIAFHVFHDGEHRLGLAQVWVKRKSLNVLPWDGEKEGPIIVVDKKYINFDFVHESISSTSSSYSLRWVVSKGTSSIT